MNGKKEYIEREAVCKDCTHYCVCKDTVADENWDENAPKEVREMFSPSGCENYKPTVDVAEVRHGNWKAVYSNNAGIVYECSECGHLTFGTSDYCVCGAKMDGGTK